MSPREYGISLADECGPLTEEQVESAARILATVDLVQVAA